jgi:TIGR03009 family protein
MGEGMGKWTWTLAAAIACSMSLHAQSPTESAARDNAALDRHLDQWKQKATAVESLVGPCLRTDVDKTYQTNRRYEGTIQFLKPDKAILELKSKKQPQIAEKYVWIDSSFYEVVPVRKVIVVYEVATTGLGEVDLLISLFFGAKLENLKKRYDLKLSREEPEYVYIDILPKLLEDKASFARVQLVLAKSTYLTRRVWVEQPNGNEVTWEFPKTKKNGHVDRTQFVVPQPPPGWTIGRLPRAPGITKVYRP